MQTLIQDIRYGVRMLSSKPWFTLVAVLTLALGVGATTSIFSVVNAVLLSALPYRDGDRLAIVWENNRQRNRPENVINLGNFSDWKAQNNVFEDMAAFADGTAIVTGDGEPVEVPSQFATTNLFSLLGVSPILGRSFLPEEGAQNQPGAVLLSYGYWQRRYGGDAGVVGRKISLTGQEATIVGVMPANFSWHIRKGSLSGNTAQMWVAWQITEAMRQRQGRFATAVARLKPGMSLTQAQTELDTIGARLEQQYKEFNTGWGVRVVPLRTQMSGEVRKALWVLSAAVGFLLLIACANVANLLLARASSRQREIAIRAAMGAGRRRLVRQLLTESLLLSVVGGLVGLGLAWWGTEALVALSPPELLNLPRVEVNGAVLGFTLAVTLLTGLIFGLAPAFESSRPDLNESLKEGGKSTGSARSLSLRNALVISEVALALALLIGAGLLIRSFSRLQSVDPGFNANNMLTMRVSLPGRKYQQDRQRIDFFRQAVERIQALPGVESAGAVRFLPFAGPYAGTGMEIEGRPKTLPGQRTITGVVVSDKYYFQTMQIPLKRGRSFTDQEATEMRHVVIVNESFVRKYFANEEPLGKRTVINMKDDNQPCEIIGVVGDSKHSGLDAEVEPVSYWPHPELAYSGMTFVIRTKGDASTVAAAARGVIQSMDPQQPVADVQTMASLLSKSVARARFNTLLLAIFAGVALLLAAVGIYGVMAFSVEQRTHEIGVRMALGARRGDVVALVLRQGMTLAVAGVGVGLVGSFLLTRFLKTLLFNVEATDPLIFTGLALALIAVSALACYIPARRATRVDPMTALRQS
jgi:putative ABC transport system permease protein